MATARLKASATLRTVFITFGGFTCGRGCEFTSVHSEFASLKGSLVKRRRPKGLNTDFASLRGSLVECEDAEKGLNTDYRPQIEVYIV
eukprot:2350518-Pyramimonas_sp.AAC.1